MEREHPLLIPFASLSAGLALSDFTGFLLPFSAVIAALSCLLLSCLVRNRYVFNICTGIFFLITGLYALTPWMAPEPSSASVLQYAGRKPVIVEGIVVSRPVATTNQNGLSGSFVLEAKAVIRERISYPATGKLQIYISDEEALFCRGDRVRLSTRIIVPHQLGLPGEFDYPRFLALRGIVATGRVGRSDDIVLIRGGEIDSLQRRADLAAGRLGNFIRSVISDNRVSSIVTALLIGDQKRIPADLNDAYTRAGVNHILSISGFHIGIIALFIVQITLLIATRFESAALFLNLRRVALLVALPAMIIYLLLTGTAPATTRSVIMLAVFVAALYVERESNPFNVLLLSAMLLVAVNPPTLFDISFQLSFLALWGITLFVPPLIDRFGAISQEWQRMMLQFTLTSIAAIAATAVPVLFCFNQASLNGIFTNFIIVPLLGYGAVLAGFCALPFVYVFPQAAQALLWLTAKIVTLSNWLILKFASIPVIAYHGITYLDMLLMLAVMTVLTFVKATRIKHALSAVLPAAAVVMHLSAPMQADGRLHVTMLSVGQGESILIRFPDGGNVLVDGGGYLNDNGRDFGERLLVPALHKLGVRRIDRMVMTHSHPDHIGGLPFAAKTFPVGEFMEPSIGGFGRQYQQLRDHLASRQTPVRRLAAGDSFRLSEGVTMTVHSPPKAAPKHIELSQNDMELNEASLVFSITYGQVRILFTADAGFSAEQRMLNAKMDLKSTILKVGHHGSRYSTSQNFLEKVRPQAALISAGQDNSFGLPAADTIEQLEKTGIRTYRTDKDGTIELVSDGTTWNITKHFATSGGKLFDLWSQML